MLKGCRFLHSDLHLSLVGMQRHIMSDNPTNVSKPKPHPLTRQLACTLFFTLPVIPYTHHRSPACFYINT